MLLLLLLLCLFSFMAPVPVPLDVCGRRRRRLARMLNGSGCCSAIARNFERKDNNKKH